MPDITGLLIPADSDADITSVTLERGDLRYMQQAVGGLIEFADFDDGASLVFNEEGKLHQLPINPRATMLLWLGNKAFVGADLVVGDCLLLGRPDRRGETTGAPEHYVKLLTTARVFEVQVRASKSGEWLPAGMRFNFWDMAYGYAIALFMENPKPVEVRVVPVI